MWKCNSCGIEFESPIKDDLSGADSCPNCFSFNYNVIEETKPKSLRYNSNKPRWSQIHYKSLEPMIRVLEYGESKYHKFNWQTGLDLVEIQESMQRHLAAIMDGELYDKESGELHMGHILSNGMFWVYHFNKNKENGENN